MLHNLTDGTLIILHFHVIALSYYKWIHFQYLIQNYIYIFQLSIIFSKENYNIKLQDIVIIF